MSDLFPGAPLMVTIDDQIACAERELKLRERVYPERVKDRKMSQDFADHQINCQVAIIAMLRQLKERGEIATRIAAGARS